MNRWTPALAAGLCLALLSGCGKPPPRSQADRTPLPPGKKLRLAFVTNGPSAYWAAARAGCNKAMEELPNVALDFQLLPDGRSDTQKRIIDDLLARGTDGIAISPVDSEGQSPMLRDVARQTLLVTQDSDAPASGRVCYVGADNVAAGKMAGELIREVLPNGGPAVVFASAPETGNTRPRLDGIRQALAGSKVDILELRPDDGDAARAFANVQEVLKSHPEAACLVGLRSYHGPVIVQALKNLQRTDTVKAVCFDDADETLQGIRDGVVQGTVAQQPYEYGRQTLLLMSRYLMGDKAAIPSGGKILIPTRAVRRGDVDAFAAERNGLRRR